MKHSARCRAFYFEHPAPESDEAEESGASAFWASAAFRVDGIGFYFYHTLSNRHETEIVGPNKKATPKGRLVRRLRDCLAVDS
jgi:hypothetical protein